MSPFEWLLVIGLWQLKLNATEIAAAADIQERTAQRCINLLDGGIFETYHLDPTRQLEHQVEADECYQRAGSKGLAHEVARRARAPRQRGLQLRGRATAEMGRSPLLGLVQRRDKTDQDAPAAQVSLEVLRACAQRDDQTHHRRQGESGSTVLHRCIQHLPLHQGRL